jgi:hypothetical protein
MCRVKSSETSAKKPAHATHNSAKQFNRLTNYGCDRRKIHGLQGKSGTRLTSFSTRLAFSSVISAGYAKAKPLSQRSPHTQ